MVLNGRICEASDELIGEANALCGSQWISPRIAVVFSEGLIVLIIFPVGGGEEVAEWRDGTGG